MEGVLVAGLLDAAEGLTALQKLSVVSTESFLCEEYSKPLSAEQVVVTVRAGGCNFYDILMAQGKYQTKPPVPFILGTEFSGIVAKVGTGTMSVKVGDRVAGFVAWGAFNSTVLVPNARTLHRIPDTMSFEEAAAFTMIYATSYYGLVYRGNLKQGETVLVHAAAGGVGSAAVQIAKALGCRVIATVGSNEKMKVVKEMHNGADVVINYNETKDWVSEVEKITKGKGVDVVYDPVGGEIFKKSFKVIGWNGRLLVVGFAGGRIPKVAANLVLLKNMSVVGVFLGAFIMKEPKRAQQMFKEIFDLYNQGKVKPLIFKSYPLSKIAEALTALGSRESYGKVVLSMVKPEVIQLSKL